MLSTTLKPLEATDGLLTSNSWTANELQSTISVYTANKSDIRLSLLKLPMPAAKWEEDNSSLTKTLVPAVLQTHCVDDKNILFFW